MEMDAESGPCIDRAPSRAGHRPSRPPLKRTNASFNAFPDLPPIRDSPTPPLDNSSSTDSGSSSSSGSDSEDEFTVDLAPLCPPSPPSPTSPCSESSVDHLFSPVDQDDWERFHDGFAPPALPQPPAPLPPGWPSTPPPRPALLRGPRHCDHYGWSNNALYELKAGLWYRRQWVWWHYEEHCRYLESLRSNATGDGIAATFFYPPPPILVPSRRIPSIRANGLPFPSSQRIRAPAPLPVDAAWRANYEYSKRIYPRFGDIADLPDSSCEDMDRRYYAVPAFKLQQFVYVTEMDALQGRPRKATSLAPPSPLARCWTPDSPVSVYSQDDTPSVSPTMSMSGPYVGSVGSSDGTHAIVTDWKYRWRMIEHLFPTPPPPPLHPHLYLPRWLQPPPPMPPQRPDTPLPADLSTTSETFAVSVMEVPANDDDDHPGDISFVSIAPPSMSDEASYTEISVHLPVPPSVECAAGVHPPMPSVSREETSFVEGATPDLDMEPVVRLPSTSSLRAMSPVAAPLAIAGGSERTVTSTLAQELERAALEETSSARFTDLPATSPPESPQTSYIAYDIDDPFGDDYAVEQ